jgi:periplasmic protein TonB
MTTIAATPELLLPWESSQSDDHRFRNILRTMLLVFAVVSVAVPLLPTQQLSREEQEEVPPHLARVILEKKTLPEEKPEPVTPKPIEKPKPKPKPEKKPPVAPAKDEPTPINRIEQARENAKVAGVLAFQDDLLEMRESVNVDNLNQAQTSRGESSAAKVERSLITAANTTGSGGINTAELSRDAGGPALSARETTQVESSIGSASGKKTSKVRNENRNGRSDQSIRRVMDQNKGAIFAVYNRALRKDPLLEGKLVFEMVIEPSGEISDLKLISSELYDEGLTRKILSRIRMIRFGAESVASTRVNYSFDFLPYS